MHPSRCLKDFTKYAALQVLGMIGLSCYILADTFFVSKGLGSNGLAALNLAIPIYSFIHGSGLMIGMGGGTGFAVQKSRGEREEADRVFSLAVRLAAVLAAVFVLLGAFFSGKIVALLGADQDVYQMSETYTQVILLFAPAFLLNDMFLCFVRNDGSPQLSMAAMLTGSMFNIVLDYIFIFPCGMGIFGAALATGLAPIVSLIVLSPYFIKKKNTFHLVSLPRGGTGRRAAGILSCGLPSLITEVSAGVVMIVFNAVILRLAGNTGVAAYGVIANLSLVVLSVYTGIAQGVQPLLSRHHGAGNTQDLRRLFRYAMMSMLLVSGIVYTGVFFGAEAIAGIFNSQQNALLQSIAVLGLRLYFIAAPFAGCNIILSGYFTSTEAPRPAHILSILRGFVVIIPVALLLSYLAGIVGVWVSFPAAELAVCLIGLILYAHTRSRADRGLDQTRRRVFWRDDPTDDRPDL